MTEGVTPTRRAFELLADETRLAIITELGDASGEGGYASLAFSELQAAVGVDDNSRFNYHLKQLLDEFVEEKERGYGLTLAGIRAYQAVVLQRGSDQFEVEPFVVEGACDDCGAERYAWYRDGRGQVGCRSCGNKEITYPVSTSMFEPDDHRSLLDALNRRLVRDYASMMHNICPYCTGETTVSFHRDAAHWDGKEMRPEDILLHAACADCSWFLYASPVSLLLFWPPVFEFFAARGVDVWKEYVWSERIEWAVTEVTSDPLVVRGYFETGGDELHVEFDNDPDTELVRVVDLVEE